MMLIHDAESRGGTCVIRAVHVLDLRGAHARPHQIPEAGHHVRGEDDRTEGHNEAEVSEEAVDTASEEAVEQQSVRRQWNSQ